MNKIGKFTKGLRLLSILSAGLIIASCGGGGGGNGGGGGGTVSVSGTAAKGAPIAGATVTLVDKNGNTLSGTTAANGTFNISGATALTPPFMLEVSDGVTTYYSVSADADSTTTINITPLTDLIIRTWYSVQSIDIDAAFTDPVSSPPPTPTAVAVISAVVQNVVQSWLNEAGMTGSVNLISTPFTADGTGIDMVLDQTTVDTSTGEVTITDGTVEQITTLTAAGGSMTVETSTTDTDTGSTSSSSNTTLVPVGANEQTTLDAITAAFNSFAAAVNAKSGSTLAAGDLTPFLDPDTLNSGLNKAQFAEMLAYYFSGKTISFSGITIKTLDTVGGTADIVFHLSMSEGGQTTTEPSELFFKKVNGSWLLSGNQRIAEIEVRAAMVRNQGATSGSGTNLVLEANVNAFTNISGVSITGGPWSATALPSTGQNVTPWATSDSYGIHTFNPAGISGGQSYTFGLTPTSGSPVSYTQTLNAVTTEPIAITDSLGTITNYLGTTIAEAISGSKTVYWTLPKTFPIAYLRLGTSVTNLNNDKCDDMGEQAVLGITSTQATNITVPSTCSGLDINWAEIYLQVYGINGELTQVYYEFQ